MVRASILGSCALALIFLLLGALKVVDGPAATQLTLASIGVSDPLLLRLAGRGLPAVELFLGAWLLSGVAPRRSAFFSLLVLSLFTSSLVLVGANSGWGAPCTCSGTIYGEPVVLGLIRNGVLLGVAAWLVRFGEWGRDTASRANRPAPVAVVKR